MNVKSIRTNEWVQQVCMIHDQYAKQLYFYRLSVKNPKNKIEKAIPFTAASKIIKYLGISLTKEV